MAIEYVGKTGTKYYVSDNPIASGGEGVVSKIDNYPSYVAKVFKDDRRTFDREKKLNAMIQHKLNEEQCKQLTWPVDVSYDQKGFAAF